MNSYAFTFTIPSTKRVYYSGRKRTYGTLLQSQQHKLICDLMTKIIWWDHFEFLDYVFEEHADKRLHIHGYAIVKQNFMDIKPVHLLRDAFYTHGQIIKIAMSNYLRLSDIQQIYTDLSFWLNYINKHQNEILYKSHVAQEQEDIKALDIPAEIKRRATCLIDTRPDDYYDTYRFTGKVNKFLVEI